MQNDGSDGGGGGGYTDTLSSLPQAAFNYINSIVGSGVIGIPYAFHKAGFGLGLLLLAFVAVITDYSLILMVSGKINLINVDNYYYKLSSFPSLLFLPFRFAVAT